MSSSAFLPPAGQDLTQASHFTLGPDVRLQTAPLQSTSHCHFPAYHVAPIALLRPKPSRHPFLPTLPSLALAQAVSEAVSEAHGAFAPLPQQPQPDEHALVEARTRFMQSSHVPLQADARARAGVSIAHAGYGWQQAPPRAHELIRDARLIFDRDSVPKGDQSKPRHLTTTYQEFFPPHHSCPQSRRAGSHLREPGARNRLGSAGVLRPPLWGALHAPQSGFREDLVLDGGPVMWSSPHIYPVQPPASQQRMIGFRDWRDRTAGRR